MYKPMCVLSDAVLTLCSLEKNILSQQIRLMSPQTVGMLLTDIPTVAVMTSLDIKSRVFFVGLRWDRKTAVDFETRPRPLKSGLEPSPRLRQISGLYKLTHKVLLWFCINLHLCKQNSWQMLPTLQFESRNV